MDFEELNNEFKYVKDSDQYGKRDAWYILKEAPYNGDCEDYSLTLLYNLTGRSIIKMFISLLTRESKLCFCKVRGIGHAVLKWRGKYIDNIQKRWVSKEDIELEIETNKPMVDKNNNNIPDFVEGKGYSK